LLWPEGAGMFRGPKFYGSATVSDKGQIVLPAKLRKEFKIKTGDQMLVGGVEKMGSIFLVKAEDLTSVLDMMNAQMQEINKQIKAIKKK